MQPASTNPPLALDKDFFGHPRGLSTLFFTEFWERFSYYGMRALLVLFMTASAAEGGLGMKPEEAGPIYAMYTSLVYLVTVPGGWLADNFLGQRKSVLYGGIIITLGHILLAINGLPFFYSGLGCVIIGTGLLKPNISTIVGALYTKEDNRRDSGFSIFYMGINLGAFVAPLVCGWLAQNKRFKVMLEGWGLDPASSWHWGFGAAAVGMFLGVVQYLLTSRSLGDAGIAPAPVKNPEQLVGRNKALGLGLGVLATAVAAIIGLVLVRPDLVTKPNINTAYTVVLFSAVIFTFWQVFRAGDWTKGERNRLLVIMILFAGAAIFWGVFEQAGSTLNLFATRSTDNRIGDFTFDSSQWQSANAAFIILLSPFFSWLWIKLGNRNPSYPTKFAIGLVFAGVGFLWMVGGALQSAGGNLVGIHWLFVVYFLHTVGELCLSPVGLSSMTKLAPVQVGGLMMGVWFLAASVGNFLGGSVSGFYEKLDLPVLFGTVGVSALVMAGVMFALAGPVKRMLEVDEKS